MERERERESKRARGERERERYSVDSVPLSFRDRNFIPRCPKRKLFWFFKLRMKIEAVVFLILSCSVLSRQSSEPSFHPGGGQRHDQHERHRHRRLRPDLLDAVHLGWKFLTTDLSTDCPKVHF